MPALHLPAHRLYLLSGPPGAGKSHWLQFITEQGLPGSMIWSAQAVQRRLIGDRPAPEDEGRRTVYENQPREVNQILRAVVEARLQQRLTIFLEAPHLDDSERKPWIELAHACGVEAEVLIFDRDPAVLARQNAARVHRASKQALDQARRRFQNTSCYAFRRIEPDGTTPRLLPNRLPHDRIDVVGDIHGIFDGFVRLIARLGYKLDAKGVPVHTADPGRRLLLLGDFVDYGPDSLKMLEIACRMAAAGHFVLCGEHEHQLVQYWESFEAGAPRVASFASAQTAMAMMRADEVSRARWIQFLKHLPAYYLSAGDEICFVHANPTYFDPFRTPYAECIFGDARSADESDQPGEPDTDTRYSQLSMESNRYPMLRGHVPQQASGAGIRVVSLDEGQAHGGPLAAVPLDRALARLRSGAAFFVGVRDSIVREQNTYDSRKYQASAKFKRALDRLACDGVLERTREPRFGLLHYRLAATNAIAGNAVPMPCPSGTVIDEAGSIVVHPLDEIPEFGEPGVVMPSLNEQVLAVEHIESIVIEVARHPFTHGLLLTCSRGGFNTPECGTTVNWIEQRPALNAALRELFSKQDLTLTLGVVDRRQSGMKARAEHVGLWLVGARAHAVQAPALSEEALDRIAQSVPLRRPSHTLRAFAEMVEALSSNPAQGFTVRAAQPGEQPRFRITPPAVLAAGFLAQFQDDQAITQFLREPAQRRETFAPKYRPLADALARQRAPERFVEMSMPQRLAVLCEIIAARLRCLPARTAKN